MLKREFENWWRVRCHVHVLDTYDLRFEVEALYWQRFCAAYSNWSMPKEPVKESGTTEETTKLKVNKERLRWKPEAFQNHGKKEELFSHDGLETEGSVYEVYGEHRDHSASKGPTNSKTKHSYSEPVPFYEPIRMKKKNRWAPPHNNEERICRSHWIEDFKREMYLEELERWKALAEVERLRTATRDNFTSSADPPQEDKHDRPHDRTQFWPQSVP